jgi:hypothetical protein
MWDKWPRTFKSTRLTTIGNLPCNSKKNGLIYVLNFCSYDLLQSFNCHQFDSKILCPSGIVQFNSQNFGVVIKPIIMKGKSYYLISTIWCCCNYYYEFNLEMRCHSYDCYYFMHARRFFVKFSYCDCCQIIIVSNW